MSIKILHIIPNLGIGGTEKMVLELCRGLNRNSFYNRVIALKSGGQTAEELEKSGIPVNLLNSPDSFGMGLMDMPRVVRTVRENIIADSPDIVQTWLTRANVVGRIASKSAGHQRIISALRVMEIEKKYHIWAEKITHRYSKMITVNCTALKKFAVQRIGIPEEKIVYIPNGIDEKRNPDQHTINIYKKKWISRNAFIFGTVGRLHEQKGIDVFLKAAKMVLNQFPNSRFLIAGEGPAKSQLVQLTKHLGIESAVVFCGWAKESLEFISILDVFVLASRWEGMPNAVMEAMISKKPVIASTVGGVTDLIQSGTEGLLIESENVKQCSDAMIQLIQDSKLRGKIAESAYEKIKRDYSMDQMISSYKKLYESIV